MTNVSVRDFIRKNYKAYKWDDKFLVWPSKKTIKLWDICKKLIEEEKRRWWVLNIDTTTISSITSHNPWYINKELEIIFWLQTDEPLKRAVKPFWWYRVVKHACEENNYNLDQKVIEIFTKYRKSHNDWVFDAYTDQMKLYRANKILSWLPDNYARGRIIWDYRRLALYWIEKIITEKEDDKKKITGTMIWDKIQLREEISEQIKALKDIKKMAESYGYNISKPAKNAKEAIQRTYFAFLSAIKEQDWAAMSLWSVSSFFDIYIEKDIKKKKLNEEKAQELIDQFVIKLRLIRQLRMDAYNQLFAGDPTWTTECIWWSFKWRKHKVTKTSFRFLQTLYNLWPAPEPNITILRSKYLPENFKRFCAKVSIDTSSIQYENDDLMRKTSWCDDNSIACCVSQTETWKSIQYFWARCNIAKALLYSINEWKDEITWEKVIQDIPKLKNQKHLNYKEVLKNYKLVLKKLAQEYVNTMNIIHYMHDKYYYEKAQMAFINSNPKREIAFGIAGLSVATDSLSAIKFAQVEIFRNKKWISTDFKINWEYPMFWNDEDQVDDIAQSIIHYFMEQLRKHKTYRNATPTLSILTITSNVVYWKSTGTTPDWRKKWEPFAPWANPMHGRDSHGAVASLNSVAKLNYKDCRDWISNTFSIVPKSLWIKGEREENLIQLLDWYFDQWAQHLNVNVLDRETLEDAMKNPYKYPQLTIRVSWYAVNFIKLSKEQQLEVIARTFHDKM